MFVFPAFLDRGGNIARHWHGYTYDKSRCSKEIGYIQRGVVFLTEELENSEENIDRYKYLIDQL
ncbi:hypothetical protein J540_1465 [Acinetobacter baumannii 1440422]|nr:hypothetical protein J540_1465 [Acinetobacter baumannii 1440422]